MAKPLTKDQFVEKAMNIHGEKYDYSLVEYVHSLLPVQIICKHHNTIFVTKPDNHIHNKGGCPVCRYTRASKSMCLTTEKFVKNAKQKYGDQFCYDKVEYTTAKTHVTIKCNEHDIEFSQTPSRHMYGSGCSKCTKWGYKRAEEASLYVLQSNDLVKIGITNRDISLRVIAINRTSGKSFVEVFSRKFEVGAMAATLELLLLKEMRLKYSQPDYKFDGSTECFMDVNLAELINKIEVY